MNKLLFVIFFSIFPLIVFSFPKDDQRQPDQLKTIMVLQEGPTTVSEVVQGAEEIQTLTGDAQAGFLPVAGAGVGISGNREELIGNFMLAVPVTNDEMCGGPIIVSVGPSGQIVKQDGNINIDIKARLTVGNKIVAVGACLGEEDQSINVGCNISNLINLMFDKPEGQNLTQYQQKLTDYDCREARFRAIEKSRTLASALKLIYKDATTQRDNWLEWPSWGLPGKTRERDQFKQDLNKVFKQIRIGNEQKAQRLIGKILEKKVKDGRGDWAYLLLADLIMERKGNRQYRITNKNGPYKHLLVRLVGQRYHELSDKIQNHYSIKFNALSDQEKLNFNHDMITLLKLESSLNYAAIYLDPGSSKDKIETSPSMIVIQRFAPKLYQQKLNSIPENTENRERRAWLEVKEIINRNVKENIPYFWRLDQAQQLNKNR